MDKTIIVRNLRKTYGKTMILKGIDFTVKSGLTLGFIGDNGAGKTTTIKILVGINKPDAGSEILVNGVPLSDSDSAKKIAYLPEKTYLPEYLTGTEFLQYSCDISGIDFVKEKVEYWSGRLGMSHALNRKIESYSKGMMQRLGIISCLLNEDADYIFLDEPVSGLDPVGQKQIIEIIDELKKSGKTIFITTHQMNEVQELCDDVIFLKSGKIIDYTTVKDILTKYPNVRDYYIDTSLKNGGCIDDVK